MKRSMISLLVLLGLFLLLASGCGNTSEQSSSAPTTAARITYSTTPGLKAPPKNPTVTTEAPTQPSTSQPTASEPPFTVPDEPTPENKLTVCIDAGHQRKGISEKEPNGPGSDVMKAKLTSGTQGVSTNITEYQLNLDVSLLLEQELLARGYNVVMIRRDNNCPLSNAERAQVANESGADVFIRIHANGSDNPNVSGALCCAPTRDNLYLTDEVISKSILLSTLVVNNLCTSTEANNQGLLHTDTMTGINWCQIPVTIVEMGYMSNPTEDELMATDAYRQKIVLGIANGIDAYFEEAEE